MELDPKESNRLGWNHLMEYSKRFKPKEVIVELSKRSHPANQIPGIKEWKEVTKTNPKPNNGQIK